MAIAIPPRDMIFEVIPKNFINRKLLKTAIGRVRIITSELLKWSRNRDTTRITIKLSSNKALFKVSIAFSIS